MTFQVESFGKIQSKDYDIQVGFKKGQRVELEMVWQRWMREEVVKLVGREANWSEEVRPGKRERKEG